MAYRIRAIVALALLPWSLGACKSGGPAAASTFPER
jgi:hypothetical protein